MRKNARKSGWVLALVLVGCGGRVTADGASAGGGEDWPADGSVGPAGSAGATGAAGATGEQREAFVPRPNCPRGFSLDDFQGCAAWRVPDAAPDFGAHTATLLKDGRVLLVGEIPSQPQAMAALFDPLSDAWAFVSGTPFGPGHTATRLESGQVLITGGLAEKEGGLAPAKRVELFDPISLTFATIATLGVARAEHAAVALADGRILLTGGYTASSPSSGLTAVTASSQVFDPALGQWSALAAASAQRASHTANLMGGQVLVVGGRAQGALDSSEEYSVAADTWTAGPSLPGFTSHHTATPLSDASLLVVGQFGAVRWTAGEAAAASATGAMYEPRAFHVAGRLADGSVLVAGGGVYQQLQSVELYDPDANSWARSVDCPLPIFSGSATLLDDGRVLIVSAHVMFFERLAPAGG